MRFQNYFKYQGKKYYTGTVMIVHNFKPKQEATFLCYDTEREMYIYQIKQCKCHMNEDYFFNSIISITDRTNRSVHIPEVKTRKECHIDGVMFGWAIYIFLMIVTTIFNDRIMMWAIWSIVFFAWRSEKIKEEGNYVEW